MGEIVSLEEIRITKKKEREQRKLDIHASHITLDNCLKFLNMNNLPELVNIKRDIERTLIKLEESFKNG